MFASRPWSLWLLSGMLSLSLLVLGSAKLLGHPAALAQFDALGYPAWLRVLVGCLEQAGAVGLLIPRYAALAALMLGFVMIVSATSLLIYSSPDQAALPIVLLVLLTLLARFSRLSQPS